MRLVIIFSFFTIITSKYLLVHIKDDGERTAGIGKEITFTLFWAGLVILYYHLELFKTVNPIFQLFKCRYSR